MILEEEAALLIARQAEGGMRDAIGLFELCAAGGCDVTAERVSQVLGLSGYDRVLDAMTSVAKGDMAKLFATVAEVVSSAKDISVFWKELTGVCRDMLVSKYAENSMEYLDLTRQEAEKLSECAKLFTLAELIYHCKILDEAQARMLRSPTTKRITAEMALLRMCRPDLDTSNDALSARLSKLEDTVALGGSFTAPAAPAAKSEAFAKEAAEPATVAAPVIEKKEAPSPAPANPAPAPAVADTASGYDRVRDISEAVGRLDGTNRGLASFLMSSTAYVSKDGKELILKVDGFGASMLSQESAKSAVSDAFALARITDGRARVTVEVKKAGEKKSSAADDLSGWF